MNQANGLCTDLSGTIQRVYIQLRKQSNTLMMLVFCLCFKNEIEGFSLEEWTAPEYWWCDDEQYDPWLWRAVIARQHDIIYGKVFGKKAGFISRKWVPAFANYRRDGYDFDALYEDGKAPLKT
mgnify:CR=1 FL=1